MSRPWNTWIAVTFVALAIVSGCNLWNISTYEPLAPFWKTLVFGLTFSSVIVSPLLTYFFVARKERWLLILSFIFLSASLVAGQIVGHNGRSDSSPVQFRNATVLMREITNIKSTTIYRLHVQLEEGAPYKFPVSTSRENYEQFGVGSVVSVPSKAGSLGIPWRVKGTEIGVVRAVAPN